MNFDVDYSLALVTDRTLMSTNTLEEAVEQGILGGCTMIQLREKAVSSQEFYRLAQAVREITKRHAVPLIINDRTDIAMAVNAEGVHIGQDDLPVPVVRGLIGRNKLLGVSVTTEAQAVRAEAEGADYLGVGAMFATGTKTDADLVPMEELDRIREAVTIPVVVIGGISRKTAKLFAGSGIAGFAVVSDILMQKDIEGAARELAGLFHAEIKSAPK
jgi:thiamine-phosphate pyrophosphorylase